MVYLERIDPLLKTGRMAVSEAWGGHKVDDLSGFQAMLKKAQEIEESNIEANSK